MAFLSTLALIMLTLVGYAAGGAVAARAKLPQPLLVDLLLLVSLWTAGLLLRPALGRWPSLLVWLLVGMGLSAVLARHRPQSAPGGKLAPLAPEGGPLRRLWRRWQRFAHEMGQFQGRLTMAFLYFLVVTPFGLASRLLTDPLHTRRKPIESAWETRPGDSDSLDRAREQS